VKSTMSRTAEVNAHISQDIAEIWGTNDPIPPEELDPREIWWRDRYNQLSNRGYVLRPRYSPQWVPSWKTSKKETGEDGMRLELSMQLEPRMGEWSP